MNKKIADILFVSGIVMIIIGILTGVILGFVTGDGFNLVPAITVWIFSMIIGAGLVSVSGSVNKISIKKQDDEEEIQMIIERIKTED